MECNQVVVCHFGSGLAKIEVVAPKLFDFGALAKDSRSQVSLWES
jgi:hypothetical protein